MCGRRLIDKSFLTYVSGLLMRRGWPLALRLCADQVPIESTHSKMRRPKRALLIPLSRRRSRARLHNQPFTNDRAGRLCCQGWTICRHAAELPR